MASPIPASAGRRRRTGRTARGERSPVGQPPRCGDARGAIMPALVPELPIDGVLPDLRAALAAGSGAVLVAPPGAGKTTRVPLVLLDEAWAAGGRILVLEPRRLAARAAAQRMAATLQESVGETV